MLPRPAACSPMTAWRSSKICEPQSRFGDSFFRRQRWGGRNIQGGGLAHWGRFSGCTLQVCFWLQFYDFRVYGMCTFRPLVTKRPGRGTPFKEFLTQDLHEQSLEMTGSPVSTSRIFLLYLNLILRVIWGLHLPNISPETSPALSSRFAGPSARTGNASRANGDSGAPNNWNWSSLFTFHSTNAS